MGDADLREAALCIFFDRASVGPLLRGLRPMAALATTCRAMRSEVAARVPRSRMEAAARYEWIEWMATHPAFANNRLRLGRDEDMLIFGGTQLRHIVFTVHETPVATLEVMGIRPKMRAFFQIFTGIEDLLPELVEEAQTGVWVQPTQRAQWLGLVIHTMIHGLAAAEAPQEEGPARFEPFARVWDATPQATREYLLRQAQPQPQPQPQPQN